MRRHRFHRHTALIVVSMAAALATVSCQAPSSSTDPDASAARPLTEPERQLLYDAEQQLTRSCMAARGFRMQPVPRRPLPEDRDFPYVIDDVRWAARHGYGSDLEVRRERLRATDPNSRYFAGLSQTDRRRAVAAYNGAQSADRLEVRAPNGMTVGRIDDGCTAQAQTQLYSDLAKWFHADVVIGALPPLRQQKVAADGEFKAAVKKWSACMRGRGMNYSDPYQPRDAFNDTTKATAAKDGDARRRKEVRTAVAEAECAHDSGLSATARRLDRHYDAQLRNRYRAEVRSKLRLERAALQRARALPPADRSTPIPTPSTSTSTSKE
ncbi:hypothetical protein [Streptomyces sp. HD]|uniref:hypothetical protein n=1 Tax=Streptomyces sp. HD TaxID=3020892 RepID=UPI00232B17F3|nr:hypothetical protein [Streptomyces sp. HD]MDC0769936.1 hypothetical protein [Streptomyces sp. HD]